MKKLNKKGITLVELLVSIVIISVVLAFLFRLLVMLRYDENYDTNNSRMIVNKSQLIQNIQTDFIEKGLNIVTCNESDSVTFTFSDNSSTILKLGSDMKSIIYNNEGRALEESLNLIYSYPIITQDTFGQNSLITFTIPVKNARTGEENFTYQIKFVYTYKNNFVTLDNCI